MMLVVGAGSFLASTLPSSPIYQNREILFLSRERPDFAPEGNWIPSNYSVGDGSIAKLRELDKVKLVVWLASPCHRSLLVSQQEEQIASAIDSGVKYQTLAIRALLPSMVSRRHGRFVFAGSAGAKIGYAGAVTYMQTKAAQAALSSGIALEYGRLGITSNVINVGVIDGGLFDTLGQEDRSVMVARTSSGKFVEPVDFWSAVEFLEKAPSVNGAEIAIDGGYR